MRQGGGPEGPEYTTVTVQEPLQGQGKPPEPGLHCCHKLPEFLRRAPRAHLVLAAVLTVMMTLNVTVYLAASIKVLNAVRRCHDRGQTAGSAAENLMDCDVLPPCDEDWIWYRNKCFYFSEAEGNWTAAKDSCAALDSTLAMIDSQQELDFLLRHKGDHDRWIGLWRVSDNQWKWINGTGFSNWFNVADHSDYAYLNHYNVKSGDSYNTRHWICTNVSPYERKYKRKKTLPSFHRGI